MRAVGSLAGETTGQRNFLQPAVSAAEGHASSREPQRNAASRECSDARGRPPRGAWGGDDGRPFARGKAVLHRGVLNRFHENLSRCPFGFLPIGVNDLRRV